MYQPYTSNRTSKEITLSILGVGGPGGLWHSIYRSMYFDQYVSSEFSSSINTSIGEDINETNAGKDYEVNILVAANDVAISHSRDFVINNIRAVGIEFNKTIDAERKKRHEVLAIEESFGIDLEKKA
ncbi:hypothetical protein Tco_1285239 [Tanacetum coccineum]